MVVPPRNRGSSKRPPVCSSSLTSTSRGSFLGNYNPPLAFALRAKRSLAINLAMILRSLAWYSRLCHSGTSPPRAGEMNSSSSARAGAALGCCPMEPVWGETPASNVPSRWESTG